LVAVVPVEATIVLAVAGQVHIAQTGMAKHKVVDNHQVVVRLLI
jgi:hypothetical protein